MNKELKKEIDIEKFMKEMVDTFDPEWKDNCDYHVFCFDWNEVKQLLNSLEKKNEK